MSAASIGSSSMNSSAPPTLSTNYESSACNHLLEMLQLHRSESELSSVAAQRASRPANRDKLDTVDQQVDSKFMSSSRLEQKRPQQQQSRTRNNVSTTVRHQPDARSDDHSILVDAKMSTGSDRPKTDSAKRIRPAGELQQWHKLLDDYERIQQVASSIARSKLIDSASSESSLDSQSSLSQASTVCATENYKVQRESPPKPSLIPNFQNASNIRHGERLKTASIVQKEARRGPQVDEASQASEVSQCLDELVESVARSTAAPDHQPSDCKVFKSFKLHEAILAKTNSGSSAATTASEDNSSCDEVESVAQPSDLIPIESLGRIELNSTRVPNQPQLVRKARDIERESGEPMTSTAVHDRKSQQIGCVDGNNNMSGDPIDLKAVADCVLDGQLVVWLVRGEPHGAGDGSPGSENGLDLDDIALALNEPVASKPRSASISALVWRCPGGPGDAKRLREIWSKFQNGSLEAAAEFHQIEVKPSEVEADSASAEQMKSSGLFVLQPDDGRRRAKTDQSRPAALPKVRDEPRPDASTASRPGQLDKSAPEQNSTTPQTATNSNLANYYRSVASKVISSGSSKFKNFTLEKGHTLARGARRLSMAINHMPSSGTNAPAISNQGGDATLETTPTPKVKPRTSVMKKEAGAHVRHDDGLDEMPKSILKKESSKVCGGQGGEIQSDKPAAVQSKASNSAQKVQNSSPLKPKLSLQEQFDRLRAGSSSSVSSRARQRRPALLLPASNQTDDGDQGPGQPDVSRPNVSTSSPIDGTVRAKVSMSHLRRSVSMKMLAAADSKQAENLDRARRVEPQDAVQAARKKSEFDPRSLRKLSSETARALRQEVATARESMESDNHEASQEERRLARERARRRRSMANLAELKSELDEEQAIEKDMGMAASSCRLAVPAEDVAHSGGQSLGRGLNLLRQSFKQKNLSAILSFATSRQSLRVKASPTRAEGNAFNGDNQDEQDEEASRAAWTGDKPATRSSQSTKRADESIGRLDQQKLEAIKVAEANLLAAKQLKQQAQRLREQQRRSEQQQQQQTSIADSAAILFYNQQIHKQQQQQHQQQQQQLIYQAQQQYAFASGYNQHMFDPMTLYQQQQQQQFQLAQQFQMQQQRQQQQLAYFSNHSAHFMTAAQHQMAALVQAPVTGADHLYAPGRMPAVGPVSVPLIGQQLPHNQPALINHQQRASKYLCQAQQQQQSPYLPMEVNNDVLRPNQHFIPMSVNHHSSFNIVYTAAAAAAAAAANQQQQQQQQQQILNPQQNQFNHIAQAPYLAQPSAFADNNMLQVHQQQSYSDPVMSADSSGSTAAFRSKHSSLGASVRKTMRSLLRNGKSAAAPADRHQAAVPPANQSAKGAMSCANTPEAQQARKPLKSALKISLAAHNELQHHHHLNSEGSDGDASSSSDSTLQGTCSTKAKKSVPQGGTRPPVSASKHRHSPPSSSTCSPSSSDSSLASSGTTQNDKKSATLTKRDLERLRRDFIVSSNSESTASDHQARSGARRSPPTGSSTMAVNQRKNVTFSTKLTSIL